MPVGHQSLPAEGSKKFNNSVVAKSRLESFIMGDEVKRNQTVVKQVGKVVDLYRQIQIADREIRCKEYEIQKYRKNNEQRQAELSNVVLSTAVLILNLSTDQPIQDMDQIFDGQEPRVVQERQTIHQISWFLKVIYCSDFTVAQPQDIRQEILQRTSDLIDG